MIFHDIHCLSAWCSAWYHNKNGIDWVAKQKKFVFLQFHKLKIQDQGASMIGVWGEPSSFLPDGHFLTVASCGE